MLTEHTSMPTLTAKEAERGGLAVAVNRAAYSGQRTLLLRHGKPVAVLCPVADLELVQTSAQGRLTTAELHQLLLHGAPAPEETRECP